MEWESGGPTPPPPLLSVLAYCEVVRTRFAAAQSFRGRAPEWQGDRVRPALGVPGSAHATQGLTRPCHREQRQCLLFSMILSQRPFVSFRAPNPGPRWLAACEPLVPRVVVLAETVLPVLVLFLQDLVFCEHRVQRTGGERG